MIKQTMTDTGLPKTREQIAIESLVPATDQFTKELGRCLKNKATSYHRLHIRLKQGIVDHCQTESGETHSLENHEDELDGTDGKS